jgi:hypothetical protein
MLNLLVVTLIILSVPGYARNNDNNNVVNDFVNNGVPFDKYNNINKIRNKFGVPLKESVYQLETDGKDNVIQMKYKDIEIEIYVHGQADYKEDIFSFKVFGGKLPIKHGIKVGMKRSKVINILGPPNSKETESGAIDVDGYDNEDSTSTVFIKYKNGKIESIIWTNGIIDN